MFHIMSFQLVGEYAHVCSRNTDGVGWMGGFFLSSNLRVVLLAFFQCATPTGLAHALMILYPFPLCLGLVTPSISSVGTS